MYLISSIMQVQQKTPFLARASRLCRLPLIRAGVSRFTQLPDCEGPIGKKKMEKRSARA